MPSSNGGRNGASSFGSPLACYNKQEAARDMSPCSGVLACVKVMGHANPSSGCQGRWTHISPACGRRDVMSKAASLQKRDQTSRTS
jgi:hypothetical protein